MALQIHCSYTSYKHLCPPVGQTAGRVLFAQTMWWSNLALTCVRGLGLESWWPLGWTSACLPFKGFACCFLKPWSHGGRWELRSFTDRGTGNATSSFSLKGSGRLPIEALCCTSLLTAHQKYPILTLWAQCRSITLKATFFPPSADEVPWVL